MNRTLATAVLGIVLPSWLVKLTARLIALYTTVQIPVDVLIKGCSKEEEGDLRVELAMLILWSRNS